MTGSYGSNLFLLTQKQKHNNNNNYIYFHTHQLTFNKSFTATLKQEISFTSVIYLLFQYLIPMAWCTCSKVIISLILGVVCINVLAPGSSQHDFFIYLGYFLIFYSMVGTVYNFLRCCVACCHKAFSGEQNEYLIDDSVVEYRPPVTAPPIYVVAANLNRSQQVNRGDVAFRETFNQEECTVCFDSFNEKDVIARLECGHKFHEQCIVDWLERQLNCPVCRAVLT